MIWPNYINFVSLPPLIIGSLLIWTGIFYIGLFSFLPREMVIRRVYLLFGLTCVSLAFYSFCSFLIYSLDTEESIYFWKHLQYLSVVPLLIFFIQFSAEHLKIRNFYFRWIMPIITLMFIPFFFGHDWMLSHQMVIYPFKFFGKNSQVAFPGLGPASYPFIVWSFANAFLVGYFWFRHFLKETEDIYLLLAFILFILTAVNDTLLPLKLHHGPFLFEFGFFGFLVAMGIQLFSNYVDINRQLVEKTRQLQEANEETRFLISTISHDLMAPLVSIHGFVDLLKKSKWSDDKNAHRHLDRIDANATHLKELMTDMTDFFRIGRVEESIQRISLKKLMEEVVSMAEVGSMRKKCQFFIADQIPDLNNSAKRIKQILVNLVENAVKYSGEEVKVKLDAIKWEPGVMITVEDNGPGIPLELQEKVFEAFFRHAPHSSGSGLGLSIVAKIAKQLGGDAWIDPEFTAGTRVCVLVADLAISKDGED